MGSLIASWLNQIQIYQMQLQKFALIIAVLSLLYTLWWIVVVNHKKKEFFASNVGLSDLAVKP